MVMAVSASLGGVAAGLEFSLERDSFFFKTGRFSSSGTVEEGIKDHNTTYNEENTQVKPLTDAGRDDHGL